MESSAKRRLLVSVFTLLLLAKHAEVAETVEASALDDSRLGLAGAKGRSVRLKLVCAAVKSH